MGALVPNATLWYMARGTGFVSVIMLTLSIALGITTTMRWSAPRWPRFVTSTLHKNVSLLSVVFLALHIAGTLFDPVSPVHLVNAIVPFTGKYRPLGIGLGVVAVDLLAALVITSLLRQRIGYRIWRAVHWSAYACWPVAMLHGVNAGTDAATTWARVVYLACAALVTAAIGWRVSASVIAPSSPRAPSPAPNSTSRSTPNSTRRVAYRGASR
jgi:sulfoxide reductase heme-binding subunit YedZ